MTIAEARVGYTGNVHRKTTEQVASEALAEMRGELESYALSAADSVESRAGFTSTSAELAFDLDGRIGVPLPEDEEVIAIDFRDLRDSVVRLGGFLEALGAMDGLLWARART